MKLKNVLFAGTAVVLLGSCARKQEKEVSQDPAPVVLKGYSSADGNELSHGFAFIEKQDPVLYHEQVKRQKEAITELERKTRPVTDPVVTEKSTPDEAVKTSNNTSSTSSTANSNSQTVAVAEPVKKRKGWSRAAKGTVIGAGSGAVLGVIVSKDKVKGGILGGLLGAGAGYVVGNEIDKKKARKQ